MNRKEMTVLVSLALAAWHALSIMKDAERCSYNLARYNAAPTLPNFVKLAVAEGVLISDLRWL
jgi:hypothetical protein